MTLESIARLMGVNNYSVVSVIDVVKCTCSGKTLMEMYVVDGYAFLMGKCSCDKVYFHKTVRRDYGGSKI